jgi:hypothetical protein
MKKSILPLIVSLCLLGKLSALSNTSSAPQYITNNVTVSIIYAYEANITKKGNIYTQAAPIENTFTTKDLISQLAKSYSKIITNGARLQALLDTNNNVYTQILNSNSSIVDVSSTLRFIPGTHSLQSGILDESTGSNSLRYLDILRMAYNDTPINRSNGISFSFIGLDPHTVTLTPTKTKGVFSVTNSFSVTNGIGDGYTVSGKNTNDVVIKNASVSASGSGILNFNK